MGDAFHDRLGGQTGVHLEDLDVFWTHEWLQRREVDCSASRRAMIAAWELHVVNMTQRLR